MRKAKSYELELIGRAIIGSIFLLWVLPSATYSAALALQWKPPIVNSDGSPLVDLAYYRLYYGFETRKYTFHIDTNSPIAHVSGLIAGSNYYFSVVAINSNGVKSDFSDEYLWNSDSDRDLIPDRWEKTFFGKTDIELCRPDADDDGDGYSNYREFVAGSNPTNAVDQPDDLIFSKSDLSVKFLARKAEGPGYEDVHRYYRLDECTNLVPGVWTVIPGFHRIAATNQPVVYTSSLMSQVLFCRVVIWLE